MQKHEEIALARLKTRPKVTLREIEILLNMPSGTVSVIEKGELPVADDVYERILDAIDAINARNQETAKCQQTEKTASAAS